MKFRVYAKAIEECGEECPAFTEDGYECGVHSCELHDNDMPAEMFQAMIGTDKKFPDFCPLEEEEG